MEFDLTNPILNISYKNVNIKELTKLLKNNSSLTHLYLIENRIGEEGAKELAEALKVNNILTVLRISSNDIGVEGAKALAEALKVNSTLTHLNLNFNNIGVEGAKALAKALKVNSSLTHLYLGFNNIGEKGAKVLAKALNVNSSLIGLYLYSSRIKIIKEIEEKLDRNIEIYETVKEIAYMVLVSSHMELGGQSVPKDIRRLLAHYFLQTKGTWLK